jgi:ATP-dependent Lon protease
VLDTVPAALKDRMECLELPGYTHEEKLEIAKRHLVPKALADHGLDKDRLEIQDDVVNGLISSYTREAGVRNLKREIDSVCRSVAVVFAEGNTDKRTIKPEELETILGPERFINELAERTEVTGVATGLAWTSVGGDILFIEATKMPGKGGMLLTGQLGDVMKESAQAALSYIRAQAASLGIEDSVFKQFDLHLHIPAGGIPKDGPSAGVTMCTALVSLLTGINVRADVAMTGEITLRGKVLPVGGIKEKVLAARRAGVKRIIMPDRNKKDLVEIPEQNRTGIEFIFANKVEDVLKHALVKAPTPLDPKAKAADKKKGDKDEPDEATPVN